MKKHFLIKIILVYSVLIILLERSVSFDSFNPGDLGENASRTYYLSGIENDIWKEITHAKPGDVFVLANNVYKDLRIVFNSVGSPNLPITLRAETSGGVVLTGNSVVIIKGQYLVVTGLVFDQVWSDKIIVFNEAKYSRLTDCAFIECGHPHKTYPHIIKLTNNSKHNRIDHCYMQGNLSMGIGVIYSLNNYESINNTFDHNYFKDILRRSTNGQEAIQLGQGLENFFINSHSLVEYNLFDNASGDAEIISSKSSSNIFRYNTFQNCKGKLVLRGGNAALVEGNFFINTGLRIHGENHKIINNYFEGGEKAVDIQTGTGKGKSFGFYQWVNDCLFANNTMINSKKIGIYIGRNKGRRERGQVWNYPPSNIKILNNIITSNNGVLIANKFSSNIVWENNLTWPEAQAKLGIRATGVIIKNPKLQLQEDGVYRLDKGSPAIDQAVAVDGVIFDINGKPRDNQPDIGCDEFSIMANKRGFLLPNEVGPIWMQGSPDRIKRIGYPSQIPSYKQ